MPKKLNKDQIQKIILSILGFIGLIYCYFTFFLTPLNNSRESMTKTIGETEGKLASSKTEVKKTSNLELQAKEAMTRYTALKATTVPGAPIAWFPPKMRNFFENNGVEKAGVRLESSNNFSEPQLSDWIKDNWAIDLPSAGFDDLGQALAKLENTEPLLAIQKITIHAVPEDPQFQQASLNVQTTLYAK